MHQTRVLPWVRASRVGDDGVQLVCQAWFWLKQLIPARLDGFSSGEGTMDTSPPPSTRHHPAMGRQHGLMVRASKSSSVTTALGLIPWVARGFPACWEVTLPPPFLIPAVGKGFFGQSGAKWLCDLP